MLAAQRPHLSRIFAAGFEGVKRSCRSCAARGYLGGGETSSAAERVAAVGSVGGRSTLALAVAGADAAALGVRATVVGRALDVHQLRVADRLAPVAHHHHHHHHVRLSEVVKRNQHSSGTIQ